MPPSDYSSLDGFEYELINDWQLEKKDDGTLELLFTTPVPTRYLKVHSKWDERDLTFNPIHNGEFINTLQNMIAVYYQVNQRVEEYQYDAGGNRKQETITLRSSTTRDYSYYPNSSKLMTNGKFAFVYDDNGNLIRKGSNFILGGDTVTFDPEGKELWIYEYDLLNRLTRVKQDGKVVAEYLYDEAGLRLKKQSQDSTVYYVFNQTGQVLYEEENGEYMEYIYVLGKHFARVDGSNQTEEQQTYFYHTDHLGSAVLVTDESVESVWSTEYTPFGGMAITEGELKKAAKFTGKDLDEDIGLYYFNARWYDSEIGRFISEDPAADPNNPNMYTYCANNPLKYLDPTGKTLEGSDDPERNKQLNEYMGQKHEEHIKLASYSDEKKAQYYLDYMGFDTGGVDGIIGVKTSAAIILFQFSQGVSVTGEVDDSTLEQLRNCKDSGITYSGIMESDVVKNWAPGNSSIYRLRYENGYLYYLTGNPRENLILHKLNISDPEQIKITDEIRDYVIYNEWIYGINSKNRLFKIGNNGSEYMSLFDKEISNFTVANNYIYCSSIHADYFVKGKGRSNYIYKISLDGKEQTTLPNKDVFNRHTVVGIVGEYVYYWLDCAEWLELARMKNDGTGDEILIDRLRNI